MKARGLITALRMPALNPATYTGNPFTSTGDVVLDCAEPGCGWHAMGPRAQAKQAWDEHYRTHHGADRQPGVILLNQPRQ